MRVILDQATMRAFTSSPAAYKAGVDLNAAVEKELPEGQTVAAGGEVFHARDAAGNDLLTTEPSLVGAWRVGRQGVTLDCYPVA